MILVNNDKNYPEVLLTVNDDGVFKNCSGTSFSAEQFKKIINDCAQTIISLALANDASCLAIDLNYATDWMKIELDRVKTKLTESLSIEVKKRMLEKVVDTVGIETSSISNSFFKI